MLLCSVSFALNVIYMSVTNKPFTLIAIHLVAVVLIVAAPRGKVVCRRCHQDGDGVHDEGEEQVLGDEGQDEGSRRQNFRDEQQEDDEWEQNADAQRHFLSRLGGKVEDEDAEERNEDGGKDQVDRVEESLAPDGDVERDVHLSGCTGVNVLVARDLDDVPRTRLPVIGQVHVFLVQMEVQWHLPAANVN